MSLLGGGGEGAAAMPSPSPGLLDVAAVAKKPEYQNNISSVFAALTINGFIGAGCLLLFVFFRTFMPQYQLRAALKYVTIKPPPLPRGIFGHLFGWIIPVITTSDVWLLHSAGLDALVLQKTQALCLQLFLPIAVLGCCLLMPLQLSEASEEGDTTFSRLTMANVKNRSKIMWAHWVCAMAFLGWALLLLEWHFREYVNLRQFYLRGGNAWNYWRELHMAEADGVGVHKQSRFSQVVETAHMDNILKMLGPQAPAELNWWRKAMAWITSWTGTGTAEDVVALAQKLTDTDSNSKVIKKLHSKKYALVRPSGSGGGVRLSAAGSAATSRAASVTGPVSRPSSAAKRVPLGEGAEDKGQVELAVGGPRAAGGAGVSREGVALPEDVDAELAGGDLLEAPEFNHMAAPKWWSSVDVLATDGGKLRHLTREEQQETTGEHFLLAKPSVRYRKTVNTHDTSGRPTAVNAQQYAVLVTNVNQPVYPEYQGSKPVRGAGLCGKPNVKHSDDGAWLGQRYKDFVAAVEASKEASAMLKMPSAKRVMDKNAQAAIEAAEAVAALEAAEAGLAPDVQPWRRSPQPQEVAPGRAQELWGRVRQAVKAGRVKKLQHSEAYSVVSAVFSALFPEDFDRVVPVFNFREVDLLMRKWDVVLGQLEVAERAVELGGARRVIKPKGSRAKVDRIEWLRAEVDRLEREVLKARERALVYNSTPSFFVLFRSQKAAAIAASCNIHPLKQELFKVHPAPGPEEVNWESLWFTHAQRVRRGFLVTPFIVVLVLLPVSLLTSAMSQLEDLFCSPNNTILRWGDYCGSQHPFFRILRAVLTGFVPTLLIQLWQGLCMPRFAFLAAQSEARHLSLSDLDRRIGSIYFLWACFNFFGGGVVGSTALARVPEFINKPLETPQLLGYALPATAKFFFTYMILRTFLTIPLRFLIPQPGVWQAWIRMALVPFIKGMRDDVAAERTLFMRNAIRSPRYGVEYGSNVCLIILIAFAFAVICPLVPLFAVGFFTGQWLFWRYQLIYNYQRKYESGGQFFPFVANRIMLCAAIMIVFTGCVMIVKAAWAQATLLWVIGLVSVYAYYVRTQSLYINGMREMPLLVAQMAPRARVPATVYVPPPLQANGWLWYPEFNRCWEFFGMPGYSW